jgi:hypothetical protein
MTENQGTSSTTYGSNGEAIYNQHSSSLPYNFNSSQMLGDNLQTQQQSAESYSETEQQNYSESVAKTSNHAHNLINHFSDNKNYSDSVSSTEKQDIQESVNKIQSTAANWGQSYGLNQQESVNVLTAASIGGSLGAGVAINKIFSLGAEVGISGTGQYGFGASREEMANSAVNASQDMSFQKAYQKLNDFAHNTAASETQDSGTRFSKDYTQSLSDTQSHQESSQKALTKLQHVSETASFYKQHSQDINQNHTQEFVRWSIAEIDGNIHEFKRLASSNNISDQKQMQRLAVGFVDTLKDTYPSVSTPSSYQNPQEAYANAQVQTIDKPAAMQEIEKKYDHQGSGQQINKERNSLSQEFQNEKTEYEMKQVTTKDYIDLQKESNSNRLVKKQQKNLIKAAWQGSDKYRPEGLASDTSKHTKF